MTYPERDFIPDSLERRICEDPRHALVDKLAKALQWMFNRGPRHQFGCLCVKCENAGSVLAEYYRAKKKTTTAYPGGPHERRP